MKNKFSKKTKTLVLLGSVLTLLFVTLMIYYFGATYPEFQKLSQKEFKIPGLETSFVPQGIEYDQTNDKFIVCGYMNNGSASRFYVIDGQTGETEKYFTLTSNLEDYNSAGNFNLACCESHLSQAKKVFELCFYNRIDEAKVWSEKIKELTKMPV